VTENALASPLNFSSGLRETNATDLRLIGRGKVRDRYELPNGNLFMVTTDRISVGDVVVGAIPGKGAVLNLLSGFWFDQTSDILKNHKIDLPHPNVLVCRRAAKVLPVEVVLRRYLASSMSSTSVYYAYAKGERVIYGMPFPDGLRPNQELPMGTIITPTTKSDVHDEPLTDSEAASLVDKEIGYGAWDEVKRAALALFDRAGEWSRRNGLLLVDTKIEFGLDGDGQLMVIDELFTPDSSRLWLADTYDERIAAGQGPDNFDKEMVRSYLYEERGWRPGQPVPTIPDDLKRATFEAYHAPYRMMTGDSLGALPVDPALLEQGINQAAREVSVRPTAT